VSMKIVRTKEFACDPAVLEFFSGVEATPDERSAEWSYAFSEYKRRIADIKNTSRGRGAPALKSAACLILHEVGGFSYWEIAKTMGIKKDTVRSQIKYARKLGGKK